VEEHDSFEEFIFKKVWLVLYEPKATQTTPLDPSQPV
jgi:hypothetical protein